MKKVITIILGLLCVLTASAVGYASPYKGAGHSSYIHSGTRYSNEGMASAPVASMRSTSYSMRIAMTSSASVRTIGGGGGNGGGFSGGLSSSNRGITYGGGSASVAIPNVRVMTTTASLVHGGSTSADTYARMCAPGRKNVGDNPPTPHPEGWCEGCNGHYIWSEEEQDSVCSICGCSLMDGCTCATEDGYCRCPIGEGWQVWAFMATMGMAYIAKKRRNRKMISKQ